MAEERILSCLDGLEVLAQIETEEDGWDSIATRIHNITTKHFCWYDLRLYDRVMDKNEHTTMLYQQLIYHLIPQLTQDETIISQIARGLFGENDEYFIESECIFTDDLYHEVYDNCVKEYMVSYRAGCIEKDDLVGDDLKRHFEFVEYANENNL